MIKQTEQNIKKQNCPVKNKITGEHFWKPKIISTMELSYEIENCRLDFLQGAILFYMYQEKQIAKQIQIL